ncbi:MAG TPA: site-specific integrase [Acidimicrobiales bacterium]
MDRRLESMVTTWLAAHSSPNTRAAYSQDFSSYLGWCAATDRDPMSSTAADVDAYRDACLSEGASSATVSRRLSGLASFFRFAESMGVVDSNPVAEVDRPAPDRSASPPVLDENEVGSLVQAARGLGPKTGALVTLLALDGMRLNETLRIDIGDLRLGKRSAAVSLDRRGERVEVRLTPVTAKEVVSCVADRRHGPLFLGDSPIANRPTRLTRFGADFLIKRAKEAARIDKPVSANLLRRSYLQRTGQQAEAGRQGTRIARPLTAPLARSSNAFKPSSRA